MKHEGTSTSRSTMQTDRLAIELNSSADPSKSTPHGDEGRVWGDTVEEVGSCQTLAGLIQSGPGDRGGSDDGGTPRPAGCAVLRVLARTACAGEAPAAID